MNKIVFVDNINLMEKMRNLKSLDKSIEIIKDNSDFITENQFPDDKNIPLIGINKNLSEKENFVNISTLIEENSYLKEKYNFVTKLKANTNFLKNELDKSILKCGNINKENINLCKIFLEGLSEISKEILKIHEVQKTEIPTRNLSRNNLYYGLIKERTQHCRSLSENYHFNTISQAKTVKNIKEKYKNNMFDNIEPHYVIYNVITNLFKENRHLYQKYQIKRKKLEWEEFEQLNSYQIFSLLYMNEVIN